MAKVRLFDVCVLGRGLGGLVAALMLQRRGAKVVILSSRSTGVFEPVLCEFLNGFTLKPILKRVGFHPTEVNAIPSLEASLQMIFPTRRMDCFGEEAPFEREVRREFPQGGEKIVQLFKECYGHIEVYQHLFNSRSPFPPKNFISKRRFNQMLEQVCDAQLLRDRTVTEELASFGVDGEFSQTVNAMELALTSLVTPWTCGAHLAHLLTLVRWEGYASPSGPISVRDMFLRKLRERGCPWIEVDSFKEIDFDRRRIHGIALQNAEWDEVRFQAAVVAGDPRGLITIGGDSGRFKAWKEEINSIPVFARKAYQIFRLAPAGVPVGMKPQGIIMPNGRPDGQPERRKMVRALRYAIRSHTEEGKPPETWIGVTAFLEAYAGLPERALLEEEIRRTLEDVIPFLDEYLIEKPDPPFIPSPEGTPGDFRQGLVYTSKSPRYLGVYGLSPETPFKNVFHASDLVFPGLGLDGEILAGLHVAHWAAGVLTSPVKNL